MSDSSSRNKRKHTKVSSKESKDKSRSHTIAIEEYDELEAVRNENYRLYGTSCRDDHVSKNRHSTAPRTQYASSLSRHTNRQQYDSQDRIVYQNPTHSETSTFHVSRRESRYDDTPSIDGYDAEDRTPYSDPHDTVYSGPPGVGTRHGIGGGTPAPGAFGYGGAYKDLIPPNQIPNPPPDDPYSWNCAGPETHWNEHNMPYNGRYKCFYCAWGRLGY